MNEEQHTARPDLAGMLSIKDQKRFSVETYKHPAHGLSVRVRTEFKGVEYGADVPITGGFDVDREYYATQRAVLQIKRSITEESVRQTGRTTAIILRAMASASADPNTWVPIADHFGNHRRDQQIAKELLGMAQLLGLRYVIRVTPESGLCGPGVHVRFPLSEIKAGR